MSSYEIIEVANEDASTSVSLKGTWSPELAGVLKNIDVDELNFVGFELPDFKGFSDIAKKVSRLALIGIQGKSYGLEEFTEIKRLFLDEPITPVFNISCYHNLEDATLCWNKKYPEAFFTLPRLEKLKLRHFDEEDCRKISNSSSLINLSILESKLRTLDGLQNVTNLKYLTLGYDRNLEEISAIGGLLSLEKLHIESCSKISNLLPVTKLKCLNSLHIEKVKTGFKNLDWVKNMPFLSKVYSEAEVEFVDWRPVFENKSIKEFSTKTYTGYSFDNDELIALANKNGRVVKVIEKYPPKNNPLISIEFSD